MLKYRGILFDDYATDEHGTWSSICKGCAEENKDIIEAKELDFDALSVCGVCGCSVSSWEDENAEVSYIDFENGEFEIDGNR